MELIILLLFLAFFYWLYRSLISVPKNWRKIKADTASIKQSWSEMKQTLREREKEPSAINTLDRKIQAATARMQAKLDAKIAEKATKKP